MKTIEITARVKVPVEATDDEIREWVLFELHASSMMITNPLSDYDLETDEYVRIRTLP